jgi:maltose/moltooligosaccharide transporter
VGIIFGIYIGVSAIYEFCLPNIAWWTSIKITLAFSVLMGGVGLLAIYFINDPMMLIFPMIGIGLAWGSILAMPYAILSSSIPARKMGVYMGIFNFFITLPQIVNGFFGGIIVKEIFNGQAIFALVMAGVLMIIAAISVLYVQDKEDNFEADTVLPSETLNI